MGTASFLLGDPTFTDKVSIQPRVVITGSYQVAASASSRLTCASQLNATQTPPVTTTKTTCWGDAPGLFASTPQTVTREFTDTGRVQDLAVGTTHLCKVQGSNNFFGEVRCIGQNFYGQVGITTTANVTSFVQVSDTLGIPINSVASIAAGYAHTCVLGGSVSCWGYNNWGQVGDGSEPLQMQSTGITSTITLFENVSSSPGLPPILQPRTANEILAGFDNTCILFDNLVRITCVGSNKYRQLINPIGPAGIYSNQPMDPGPSTYQIGFSQIPIETICVFRVGTGVPYPYCAGKQSFQFDGDYSAGADGMSAGRSHMCLFVDRPGSLSRLYCVGSNEFGQISTKEPDSGYVNGVYSVTQAAAGDYHTCIVEFGAVRCFGSGMYGELGNGTAPISRTDPITVTGLESGVTKLAAGHHVTCAVQNDRVKCWGLGRYGQMGNGTMTEVNPSPIEVTLPMTVTDITVSNATDEPLNDLDVINDGHVCALLADGTVWCWGANTFGKLGSDSFKGAYLATPTQVTGVVNATSIDSGSHHTCATVRKLDSSNNPYFAVQCWGSNAFGQIASAKGIAIKTPKPVKGITPADWTMMFYLSGDDPKLGRVMQNAAKSLDALPRTPKVNVVVLLDGNGPDDMYLWEVRSGRRYRIGQNRWRIPESENDMSKPKTLSWFIQFAHDYYPAQRYYLNIADHGRGTSGTPWDRQGNSKGSNSFAMSPRELQQALLEGTRTKAYSCGTPTPVGSDSSISPSTGNNGCYIEVPWRFDVIHFDSCLMSLVESAFQIRSFADYTVASENLLAAVYPLKSYVQLAIEGEGGQPMTPRNLAKGVANVYFSDDYLDKSLQPRTISVLNLRSAITVQQKLDDLLKVLGVSDSPNQTRLQFVEELFQVRNQVQTLDESPQLSQTKNLGQRRIFGTLDTDDAYVDLYDFVRRLQAAVPSQPAVQQAAQVLLDTLRNTSDPNSDLNFVVEHLEQSGQDRLISNNRWDLANTHGVAIYFPRNPSELQMNDERGGNEYRSYVGGELFGNNPGRSGLTGFTAASLWESFLESFYRTKQIPAIPPIAPRQPPVLLPELAQQKRCDMGRGACIWGSVFLNGLPVADAEVTMTYPAKQLIRTISQGFVPTDTVPIYKTYARPNGFSPPVAMGDVVIINVAYQGKTATQSLRVTGEAFTKGGQEVSIVLDATQASVASSALNQPSDLFAQPAPVIGAVSFPRHISRASSSMLVLDATPPANDGSRIVAYRWQSNKDGVLSTMAGFSYPAASLSSGVHEMSVVAINEWGIESQSYSFRLFVDVPAPWSYFPMMVR